MPIPTVEQSQALDTARGALKALRERGWFKNGWVKGTDPNAGAVCAAGAINVAQGRRPEAYNQEAMQPVVEALGFPQLSALCAWNVQSLTTEADVIARFEEAIEKLECLSGSTSS